MSVLVGANLGGFCGGKKGKITSVPPMREVLADLLAEFPEPEWGGPTPQHEQEQEEHDMVQEPEGDVQEEEEEEGDVHQVLADVLAEFSEHSPSSTPAPPTAQPRKRRRLEASLEQEHWRR